jgi:hypothetical protein
MPETPFDSIESAHEYVDLLALQTENVRAGLQTDIADAVKTKNARHLEALRLVDYKLTQLSVHLGASRRILNDLRMLRRLLVGEPDPEEGTSPTATGLGKTS